MKVLAVFAHPRRDSYCGAVLDALLAGFGEAGHAAELADLYREDFEPRFQVADGAQFQGGAMPPDVRREQARVDAADALVFVFPIWWWSFPAILKGWIDRVFSEGWAYRFEPGLSRGLLRDRPTLLVGVGGSREATFRKYGYLDAMRAQIDIGILGYCGLQDVQMHCLYDAEQDAAARARFLAQMRAHGRDFLAAGRVPRRGAFGAERRA